MRKRVVIVGAGFAGLAAMRGLRKAPVDITIVDRHNYHLFQPLLYQVASALLDPSAIAYPVRSVARRQHNARVRLAEVIGVGLEERVVQTSEGELPYDFLVMAAGARSNDFGIAGIDEWAYEMKTLDDALALRVRILEQFEKAAATTDAVEKRCALTFCIAGAGPSGVEFAGALSELIRLMLKREYPEIDMGMVEIVLVEATQDVLGSFAPRLRQKAAAALRTKDVRLIMGRRVKAVEEDSVLFDNGETLAAGTVIWTAGVQAEGIAAAMGERGSMGRVPVDARLRMRRHPEVYVAGDLAECMTSKGRPFPMLGGVAVQEGHFVAEDIAAVCRAEANPKPFRYIDKGTMATIGRNAAIVQIGPLRYAGRLGWLTWLFVHLMLLVGFRNRAAAFLRWAWDYVFYDRPVRLITESARRRR